MMGKAKILKVGQIIYGIPINWHFDCGRTVDTIEVKDDRVLYGGYTVDELQQILDEDPEHIYDTRLTAENLSGVLLYIMSRGQEPTFLKINNVLYLQAKLLNEHVEQFGCKLQIIDLPNDPEKAGEDRLHENFSEAWRIEDGDGNILFKSDGDYNWLALQKRRGIKAFLEGGKIERVDIFRNDQGYDAIQSMVVDGVKFDFTISDGEAIIEWDD